MLYFVGLGLSDEKDVTLKGLEAIRKSSRVYLEAYTSMLIGVSKEKLEEFYGKPLILADRDTVESEEGSTAILENVDKEDVSFLVVGDPFGATTHTDLLLRLTTLYPKDPPYTIIHNASILTALGPLGLSLYNYGQVVSIPFFTDTWRPSSWLPRIRENLALGLHTLCLLDIRVRERTVEGLARGKEIFEPPRFMSVTVALEQLISLLDEEDSRSSSSGKQATQDDDDDETTPAPDTTPPIKIVPSQTLCISASRLSSPSQTILSGTMSQLAALPEEAFGEPLHSFVIVGKRLHPVEREVAGRNRVEKAIEGREDGDGEWGKIAKEAYKCVDGV